MKKKILVIFLVFLIQIMGVMGQENFKETEKVTQGKDTIHRYVHEPTGMEVVWVETADRQWSFVLGVRTPVGDDTGVNHIIEHTVFKGSKRFPSHQLFFEASAKYPHSFMNAMTSADMTYYPFSTPYPKCFEGLLQVYLDSIFHPLLLEQPYSFYEEAYYKDTEANKEGGVVYNEMKGATSSIERQIFRSVREAYFEGGTYGYDSGGMPREIPKLTYKQFKETYLKYYYPSNMMIGLYGNLPIEKTLETISEQLEGYQDKQAPVVIDNAVTQKDTLMTKSYESVSSKAYVMKSFLIDQEMRDEEALRLSLWVSAYLQDSEGAFQTALRQAGLNHVQIIKDEGTKYPLYTVVVGDVPMDQVATTKETLEGLTSNWQSFIEPDLAKEQDLLAKQKLAQLQAAGDAQRGLTIMTTYLEDWLHGREGHSYYKQLEAIGDMTGLDSQWCTQRFAKALSKTIVLIPSKVPQSQIGELPAEQLKAWEGM
ncbi:MAG: insulinase family protein, partial [Cellulosilyticaceae bacterium]